jgi:hypothetical protein
MNAIHMNILLIILSLFTPRMEHDIHVSICDMTYKEGKGQIEVSIKVFYDDLLNAVGLKPGEELPENYTNADELIEAFINKNIQVRVNGEEKVLKYEESHSYPPAVWSTFSIAHSGDVNQIHMKNSILTDLFDDQVNMVNIRINGDKKAFSLDGKQKLLDFKYKE